MISITAQTRLLALLGDPVAHSLSPIIQNAALRAVRADGVYVALRCDIATFPALLRALTAAGAAGNVTIPHKQAAAQLLDYATNDVARTGACNTFWMEQGRLHGDNTDVAGFAAAVRALIGGAAGTRVLLLGAGGAARAALAALLDERPDSVVLTTRSPMRAERLRDALDPEGARVRIVADPDVLARDAFDLVVNATPLGLGAEDPLPFELEKLRRVGAVLDLVYGPAETPWVRSARARGIPAADGLEMLVQQGARAFERWWGVPAPVAAMHAAAAAARTRSD